MGECPVVPVVLGCSLAVAPHRLLHKAPHWASPPPAARTPPAQRHAGSSAETTGVAHTHTHK